MKISMRMAVPIAFLACAAALSGCGEESSTGPRSGKPLTVIAGNVIVAGEGRTLSFVAADDSTLVFGVSGTAPDLPAGSIIVVGEGQGYVRRVRSAHGVGGRLIVRTAPAFLSDAIFVGGIDTSVVMGFGPPVNGFAGAGDADDPLSADAAGGRAGARAAGGVLVRAAPGVTLTASGLSFDNTTIFSEHSSGESLSVYVESGRVEFDPTVGISARISLNHLDAFRASVDGDMSLSCSVSFLASGRVDVDARVPLAEVTRSFVQRIGPVPVVEVVTLRFMAGIKVDSDFTGVASTGLAASGRMTSGIRYAGRRWTGTFSAAPVFEKQPFTYEGQRPGRFDLTIEPEVDIAFYGIECVTLGFGPHLALAETNGGFPVLEWELLAGMEGEGRFERGALDGGVIEYDAPGGCCESTLESGPFRTDDYIYVREWGDEKILWDGTLMYPKGIAAGGSGDLYVADNWLNRVIRYTPAGGFVTSWGDLGAGDGQFDSPEKIAVDENGYVYVADSGNDRIQKFSSDGAFVAKWGSEGDGDGELNGPVGVAARGGVVYVTDAQNNRVERFTSDGAFLGAWGEYGAGPGQFDGPAGIAVVPSDGTVLVADCRNSRIQRFSPAGEFIGSWGSSGSADGLFDCAIDVTVAPGGDVFAADLGNNRFMRFAPDGTFVTKLGSFGAGQGEFDHPEAVAVDGRGWIYVVDSRNRRVQEFAPRATGEPAGRGRRG